MDGSKSYESCCKCQIKFAGEPPLFGESLGAPESTRRTPPRFIWQSRTEFEHPPGPRTRSRYPRARAPRHQGQRRGLGTRQDRGVRLEAEGPVLVPVRHQPAVREQLRRRPQPVVVVVQRLPAAGVILAQQRPVLLIGGREVPHRVGVPVRLPHHVLAIVQIRPDHHKPGFYDFPKDFPRARARKNPGNPGLFGSLLGACGEEGIRTLGTVLPVRGFSKAVLSTTQPPLRRNQS